MVYLEGETIPNIVENVTHSEYSNGRQPESHIPQASFVFENGLPIRLNTTLRSYEVTAYREVQTSEQFFKHEIERDEDGQIRTVHFDNEQAAMLFGQVASIYRRMAIGGLARATTDELALAHYDKAGGYDSKFQGVVDEIYKNRLVREVSTGKPHDPRNELILLPKDIADTLGNRAKNLTVKYSPPKPTKEQLDKKGVYFTEDDWYDDMIQEALGWVEGMQQTGVDITVQLTTISTGRPFHINRVQIGSVQAAPEENFMIECEVARNVVFAADTLKMGMRPGIVIFDTAQFEEVTPWGAYTSKMLDFIGTEASQSRNMIFISESAMRIVDNAQNDQESNTVTFNTHNRIFKARVKRHIAHEVGHFVDREKIPATNPQKEGFARSMENGFVFENAVRSLRGPRNLAYGRDITPEFLFRLLSQKPEGAVLPETYDVTSTFFCWLYEKVGPDKFRNFYGNLTGSWNESTRTGFTKVEQDWKMREKRTKLKGNVLQCLDNLPHDHTFTWDNSNELVAEYIRDVNRGLKIPMENAATLAGDTPLLNQQETNTANS